MDHLSNDSKIDTSLTYDASKENEMFIKQTPIVDEQSIQLSSRSNNSSCSVCSDDSSSMSEKGFNSARTSKSSLLSYNSNEDNAGTHKLQTNDVAIDEVTMQVFITNKNDENNDATNDENDKKVAIITDKNEIGAQTDNVEQKATNDVAQKHNSIFNENEIYEEKSAKIEFFSLESEQMKLYSQNIQQDISTDLSHKSSCNNSPQLNISKLQNEYSNSRTYRKTPTTFRKRSCSLNNLNDIKEETLNTFTKISNSSSCDTLNNCSENSTYTLDTEATYVLDDMFNLELLSPVEDNEVLETYSIKKTQKIVIKKVTAVDEAYKNWLSAKRRESYIKKKILFKQKEFELENEKLKKDLNQLYYQKWLETKININSTQKNKTKEIKTHKNLSKKELDAKKSVEEWHKKKAAEAAARRQEQKRLEAETQKIKTERSAKAVEKWQKWNEEAHKKPKPVPNNRGLLTLKGTVSDIFMQKKEWLF